MTSEKRRQRELRRIVNMALGHPPKKRPPVFCAGCYDSFSGPWCDNCDQWPCTCTPDEDQPSPDPRVETPTEE